MTMFNSNLASDKSNKMKARLLPVGVVVAVAVIAWVRFHADRDVSAPSAQLSNPVASSTSTHSGQKWFDNVTPEAAQKSASIYAMDADGNPLNLNGLTVTQYVKGLYDAANKGDAKAAFNIYSVETLCVSLPQRQRELANIPANSAQNYVDALQAIIKNAQAACADFNLSSRERLDYLHTAAKGGNVSALLMSAQEVPEGIDPLKPLDMNDPRAVQWQKDTVDYLTQAAAKGSAVAMTNLSSIYEQGNSGTPNIPLALTYQIAAMMQQHPNTNIPDNAPAIGRMTSQLTPDQIATARADAAALIKASSSSQ